MSEKVIGGYFELEAPNGQEYYVDAIRLNTGRHSLEYILRAKGYKKIYLPYYTCDVLFQPIERLQLEISFYTIDESFYPNFDFEEVEKDEVFLYTNYFGICDNQVRDIVLEGCNIIIDNAQAFFAKAIQGTDTFYSPRKFFGVPDGAYLYTDRLLKESLEYEDSSDRLIHLINRIEKNAEAGYEQFKKNNASFSISPIKRMSHITRKILRGLNYKSIKQNRIENFQYIHKELGEKNQLGIELDQGSVPMVYPFLVGQEGIKEFLIDHKVYVATYWPNVFAMTKKETIEYRYAKNIVPIPIDQRYNIEDMKKIKNLILEYLCD